MSLWLEDFFYSTETNYVAFVNQILSNCIADWTDHIHTSKSCLWNTQFGVFRFYITDVKTRCVTVSTKQNLYDSPLKKVVNENQKPLLPSGCRTRDGAIPCYILKVLLEGGTAWTPLGTSFCFIKLVINTY